MKLKKDTKIYSPIVMIEKSNIYIYIYIYFFFFDFSFFTNSIIFKFEMKKLFENQMIFEFH